MRAAKTRDDMGLNRVQGAALGQSASRRVETLIDNGFMPIPMHHGTKQPVGRRWNSRVPSPDDFAKALRRHGNLNIGLRCDGILVVDIDEDERAKAERIAKIAMGIFGPTPLVRFGRGPRRALIYRAGPNLTARRLGPVEIKTGAGHALVAFGRHPSGGEYTWEPDGSPDDTAVSQLPKVTAEQMAGFISGLLAGGLVPPRSNPGKTAAGVQPDDGRDYGAFLTVERAIRDLHAAGRSLRQEDVVQEAWLRFSTDFDLNRPQTKTGRPWSIVDIRRKVKHCLRPDRLQKILSFKGATATGKFWTLERKCTLRDRMEEDERLNAADKAVGWAMLEAVRDERGIVYASAATLAKDARVHPVTASKSRVKLVALGYFECVERPRRQKNSPRATPPVLRPNTGYLLALTPVAEAHLEQTGTPHEHHVEASDRSQIFVDPIAAPAKEYLFQLESPEGAISASFEPTHAGRVDDAPTSTTAIELVPHLQADLFGAPALDMVGDGHKLRERRMGSGMTQAELAALINVSRPHLSNVERGHDGFGSDKWRLIDEILGRSTG